ncbi:hypothetical protein NW762_003014 [Fusarium torreyae]|uniref:Uncharacterized protein n=1 Tax=Fusarium torreyae TaxID=1237075 RepID=A0A9W8SD38_9HYPO|nr:hypothetical protein NW762_003014 [Fusarium torreyae]
MANSPLGITVAERNISGTVPDQVQFGDPLNNAFIGNYMARTPVGHVSNMAINPMSNTATDYFPMVPGSNSSLAGITNTTPATVNHPMMSNTVMHHVSLSHGPGSASSRDPIADSLMASVPLVSRPSSRSLLERSMVDCPPACTSMANPQMLPTPSATPVDQTALPSLSEWRRASPLAVNEALRKAQFRAQFVVGARKDEGVWLCKKCVALLCKELHDIDDYDVRVAVRSFEVENNLMLGCIEHDEAERGKTRCKFCKKRLMCRFCIRLPDGFTYDLSSSLT